MKYLFLLFFASLCTVMISIAQPGGKTRIYLVRHAEKDTGKNPVLTPAGRIRAGDLARELQHKGITRIYTTPYRRTMMTGDSLRLWQQVDTVQYIADTLSNSLLNLITGKGDKGKTILVIGHSNTIPALVRKLGVKDYGVRELPETEFDNLFLVTYKKGKASVKILKYGKPSVKPEP